MATLRHRIVHDARVDLLLAVMLGTFARNKPCEEDMRNPGSLRQAEVAHCLHRLGVSNSWVWRRLSNDRNRDNILRRSRLPEVTEMQCLSYSTGITHMYVHFIALHAVPCLAVLRLSTAVHEAD